MGKSGASRVLLFGLLSLGVLSVQAASTTPASASVPAAGMPVSGATTSAQADSLLVTPNFRVGETRRLQVEKSSWSEAGGATKARQNQGGSITLQVLAQDAAGTRLEAVYGRFMLLEGTDPAIRDNPLLNLMLASREGVRVRLVAGPRFTNLRVENIDDVLADFRKTLTQVVATLPPEVGVPVQRLIENMMVNQQAFAAKIFDDLFAYFAVMGVDVPLQGAQASAGQTPSMMGGTPVRTWSVLRVERLDRSAGTARLRFRQTSNPQDARTMAAETRENARREALAQGVGGAASGDGHPAHDAAAVPDAPSPESEIGIVQEAYFDIDLATGWPLRVSRENTVQAGTQKGVETLVVRQQVAGEESR